MFLYAHQITEYKVQTRLTILSPYITRIMVINAMKLDTLQTYLRSRRDESAHIFLNPLIRYFVKVHYFLYEV